MYSTEELENILLHEKVHSQQRHSIDVLVAHLFAIVFWINPIVWFYKKAIIQNLEFIADNNAIQQIEDKKAYQKVLFYSGLQSFTDGEYQEALQRFEKAISQQKEASITARATFWKGETQFVLDDFINALLSFKQFLGNAEAKNTAEFTNCNYNIAYAYFKMKDYDQAGNYFQKQIEKGTDKARMNDAYLRLADCRFVTSKYAQAMEAYAKVIEQKSVDADYAFYQRKYEKTQNNFDISLFWGSLRQNIKDRINAFI